MGSEAQADSRQRLCICPIRNCFSSENCSSVGAGTRGQHTPAGKHAETGGRTLFVVVEVLEELQQLFLVSPQDALDLWRLLRVRDENLCGASGQRVRDRAL